MSKNVIVDLTFNFALSMVDYCELLESEKKFVIARQLLKSATSIGANVKEAQGAESRADFIHKLKIAAKEVEETEYWLWLCKESKNYPSDESHIESLTSIAKVLSKIISSSKRNSN